MTTNPNLVPEVRTDKNGKQTTRHVLSAPRKAGSLGSLPAPKVAVSKTPAGFTDGITVRKSQTQEQHRQLSPNSYLTDAAVLEDTGTGWRGSTPYSFVASDAEIYEVMSTVENFGTALKMLNDGVRSAEEAHEYVSSLGADDLIVDRTQLMRDALSTGIDPLKFMSGYNSLKESERESPHLMDAIAFTSSAMYKGSNQFVRHSILDGSVDYADIRRIGAQYLVSRSRLHALHGALIRLKRGEGGYDVEDLRTLVHRAHEQKLNQPAFENVMEAFWKHSDTVLNDFKDLNRFSQNFHSYARSPIAVERDQKPLERAIYATLLQEGLNDGLLRDVRFSDKFFDEDIPVEIAINAISNGGGLNEALAVTEGGVHTKLADGWL